MKFGLKIGIGATLFISTRFIDGSNTTLLLLLRTYALLSLFFVFSTWIYIWTQIQRSKKTDKRKITISDEILTIQKYDKNFLVAGILKRCVIFSIVTFMHLKFGALPPVLVAPTMNLISLSEDALFRLYVLKQEETRYFDLKRPFYTVKTKKA